MLPRAHRALPKRSPGGYALFPRKREAKDGLHGDTRLREPDVVLAPDYETDISCVLLESAVAPECAGDGIEDRRLAARDTAPQTEQLGESTP